MPLYPSLYQINTRIWLNELSRQHGRRLTLADVPDSALDTVAAHGFDWVWLLGVWQTGPVSRQISLTDPGLRAAYSEVLPDWRDEDVTGSPFAVQAYHVHADFGGDSALAQIRQRLAQRGLRLLLDFVPNHTALDHAWVRQSPKFYIPGDESDVLREPHNYQRVETTQGPRVLAHGRDPYFPGWTDTLQLNYRHPGFRQAMLGELTRIAGQCDGVRCDMAMLLLPDVIARTWGERSRPEGVSPVDTSFWPEAIAAVKARHPEFIFMAEVYWDLEWTLQQQGFDYTYDKRLYDRLHQQDSEAVRGHLLADAEYQRKSVRFLENHDEPRAAGAFLPGVHEAAAVVAMLVPGMRFFYEGELEGRRVRASIHMGRRLTEPVDAGLQAFYRQLLDALRRPEVRDGSWRLLACRAAWDGNGTWTRFLAFSWEHGTRRLLVVVNYGATQGQCRVELPFSNLRGRRWQLHDSLAEKPYDRDGNELSQPGLYVDLPAWGRHVFEVQPIGG